MTKLIKGDDEVALEDVTRLAARSIRVLEDLAGLTEAPEVAERLRRRANQRDASYRRLCQALHAHGQAPAAEDPERAHLQALWFKVKAAVGSQDEQQVLADVLDEQERALVQAIDAAQAYATAPDLQDALRALAADALESGRT
jgi:uncharacterized protein (TIGR02284 family)